MTQYSSAALTRLALYKQILDDLQERKEREAGYAGEGCLPGESSITLIGIAVRDATGTCTLTSDDDFNVNEMEVMPPAIEASGDIKVTEIGLKASALPTPAISADPGNVLTLGKDGGLYCAGSQSLPLTIDGKPASVDPTGLPDPTLAPKSDETVHVLPADFNPGDEVKLPPGTEVKYAGYSVEPDKSPEPKASEHEDFLMHADPDTLSKAS